jgi:broad specificity phosphatase PhoE
MAKVYLIRHGHPAATWGDADDDPGLDDAGKAQAEDAARILMALPVADRPTHVVSSPLRRCRETAEPYAKAIGAQIQIDPAVGEIPTPSSQDAASRGGWLRQAFTGLWSQIEGDIDYDVWRKEVAAAVAGRANTAVFSHFVAINAVISHLSGDDRVISFRPDHCSMTVLDIGDDGLTLVARGPEAQTGVL